MKFVIVFCKACSCCTASTSVAKPALNEYILVALITDLDKKKKKERSKPNAKNYTYIKQQQLSFFLFIVKCMKYNN